VSCFLLPARIPEIILGTLHRPPEELIRLAVTPREDVLVRIVRPYPLRVSSRTASIAELNGTA
jgi:hypothetical protein